MIMFVKDFYGDLILEYIEVNRLDINLKTNGLHSSTEVGNFSIKIKVTCAYKKRKSTIVNPN